MVMVPMETILMREAEAADRAAARKKCPPRKKTIANDIRTQVRGLEKQIADAERKAKAKHDAGVILLEYLKMLAEGQAPNTTQFRRIRGAAAEFINP